MNQKRKNNTITPTSQTLRNRRRRQRRAQNRGIQSPMHELRIEKSLSGCAAEYLKAVYAPFATFPEPPCIPDTISLPSWKFNTFTRTNSIVGTAGVGFVGLNPFNPFCKTSAGTQLGWILRTDATFAGTHYSNDAIGTAQINSTAAVFGSTLVQNPSLQYRVVGVSVRVKFLGNVMNQQGLVFTYRAPGNHSIPNGWDSTQMLLDPRSIAYATGNLVNKWAEVCYFPDSPELLGYHPTGYYEAICDFHRYAMIIMFEGVPPGTAFQVEASGWYECIGSSLPSLTRSESDVEGMGAVLSAAPVQLDKTQPGVIESVYKKASEFLQSSGGQLVAAVAGRVAGQAIDSISGLPISSMYRSIGAPREPRQRQMPSGFSLL